MTCTDDATVFVIDDDVRMRAATERLLKSVGLHAELFATPKDFLTRKLTDGPSCLAASARCATSRDERAGCAAQIGRGGSSDPDHFHH